MRKTYAYNSIFIGALLAMLVWAKSQSVLLAILTLLAVSVVGFLIIRALEKAISKGVDAAEDTVVNAVRNRQMQKKDDLSSNKTTNLADRYNKAETQPQSAEESPQAVRQGKHFCTNCGAELEAGAKFCLKCGQKVE